MKTVLYYTSAYFLDPALEIINTIKDKVNLHVLIEVTSNSKQTTILNIDKLPERNYLVTPEEVLSAKDCDSLKPFFEGVCSVHFVIHSHHSGLSWSTVKASMAVNRFIKKIRPEIIHFDGFSLRTIGILPKLFKREKTVLTIHDAKLHSGENTWKTRLPRFLFLKIPIPKVYAFYSNFTKEQFIQTVSASKGEKVKLDMPFYTYYDLSSKDLPVEDDYILFFGRLSKYKGIPFLLDAMPEVWKEFPESKLVIAGAGTLPEVNDHPVLLNNKDKITFINRHIPNEELAGFIRKSKFIVCPYTDASQSGVVMTAFGLSKPVVTTNVGAFSEFIIPGYNGFIAGKVEALSIAEAMKDLLRNKKYLEFSENLKHSRNQVQQTNAALLTETYN